MQGNDAFISLGQAKSLNFSRREKPLKSFGTASIMKIFQFGMSLTQKYIFILIWFVESGLHKQKTDERPVNSETDKELRLLFISSQFSF